MSKSGRPWGTRDIEDTFEMAARRCARFGREGLHVSPHTLRHTFAVHQLTHLITVQFGSIAWARQERDRVGWSQYARMLADPLDHAAPRPRPQAPVLDLHLSDERGRGPVVDRRGHRRLVGGSRARARPGRRAMTLILYSEVGTLLVATELRGEREVFRFGSWPLPGLTRQVAVIFANAVASDGWVASMGSAAGSTSRHAGSSTTSRRRYRMRSRCGSAR